MRRFGQSFPSMLSLRRAGLFVACLALICLRDDRVRSAQAPGGAPPMGTAVITLSDGRELWTGGVVDGRAVAQVWLRDPQSGAVTELPNLLHARAWHSATTLPDGRIAIVGGVDARDRPIGQAELLDASTGRSEPLQLTIAPSAHTSTLLNSHELLIAGGIREDAPSSDLDVIDIDTWTVRRHGDLPEARAYHAATLLGDGRVAFSGGQGPNGQNQSAVILDAANAMAVETGAVPADPTLAWVVTSDPTDGATDAPLLPHLMVQFSRPVSAASVNPAHLTLTHNGQPVSTRVVRAESGRLAFITPVEPLEPGTAYVLAATGLQDQSGQAFASYGLTFTTTSAPSGPNDEDDVWDPVRAGRLREWSTNRPPSPWQALPRLMAPPGVTALSGQVLRLNGAPLANVRLRVAGVTTTSDQTGRFLVAGNDLTTGWYTLEIDGRTANGKGATYGTFQVGVRLTAGQTSVLPYTTWMPKIDVAHAVTIPAPTTAETVVTTPLIPGLELHLEPGTVITDQDGRVAREISITPIPLDRTPHPLPVGVDVPIYFTIQPGGAYVAVSGSSGARRGARLVYPNYRGRPSGTSMDFWHYMPQDGRGWYVYGRGQVSRDARQVVPDPGVFLYTFTGAMVAPPSFAPSVGSAPGTPGVDGDPVDLSTGLFILNKTDLAVQDVVRLALRRTYRQSDSMSRAFGIGATHNYDIFLVGTTFPYTYMDLILPDGGRVHFDRISPGTSYSDAVYEHTSSPTSYYKARISWDGSCWCWKMAMKDGTLIWFPDGALAVRSMQGAALRIQDRYGNAVQLTRNAAGDLTQILSPNGRYIDLAYDTSHRITQATDNIGRTVQYTYDGSGRLWKVTDPMSGVTEYTYDTSHRMLTLKDARGIVFLTNQYDANGRVSLQTQADGSQYQFAYTLDVTGKVSEVTVTDPRGTQRHAVYNTAGYMTTDTAAVGQPEERTVTYAWQSGTNLLQAVADGLNRQTAYTYDTAGNRTSITRLAGTANAVTTTYTYESLFNQLASVTDPLNHTTTLTYDTAGNLTTVTDPLSRQTTFTYNTAGQPLTVTTSAGTTHVAYDRGMPVTTTDPLGRSTTRYFDAVGRQLRVSNPLNQSLFDTYDPLNRVTQSTDGVGNQTTFTYDANSNLLTFTDALNHTTTYTYDNMDRVATRVDPLSRSESYEYDLNGDLAEHTDRKSQLTTYTYDRLDRLITVTYADTSTTVIAYDAGDRVTQVADSLGGTITRTWDLLDRLTQETAPEGTITYTYDAADRRASMTVAGQTTVNYTYDAAGQLSTVSQGTSAVGFTYDSASRRSTLALPNGVNVSYGYDAASQLTSLTYTLGSTTLGNLVYSYDLAGRRSAVGGLWARTGLPSALNSASYDAANQLLTRGAASLTYDSNGNLISDGLTAYTWNARDELVGLSGARTASFGYDGMGRRRHKVIGATSTDFMYDGANVIQELSGGSPAANLLAGLSVDDLITRTDAAGTSTVLTDGLGSTLALADGNGAVQTEYTYEPFGTASSSGSPSANSAQFTGRENDGAGLHYYRARYYDSTQQRFLSEDPIESGRNRYSYVNNQPITWIDPLGLQEEGPKPEPKGGPPFPPAPGRPSGEEGWRPLPSGRWVPKVPVPSPKGGQPDASWDPEDGWWRRHPGDGGKTDHFWPDGSPAPDRHPKYPPLSKRKETPDESPWFCSDHPLICVAPLVPLLPFILPEVLPFVPAFAL